MGTGDILLGLTLQWQAFHPGDGGVVCHPRGTSCYRNWVKLQLCGPLRATVQLNLFTLDVSWFQRFSFFFSSNKIELRY